MKPFDPVALRIGQHYHRGLAAYVEAGRLLIAKKVELGHGRWLPWLKRNANALGFSSDRTAQYLMKTARGNPKLASDLELFDAAQQQDLARQLWGHKRTPQPKPPVPFDKIDATVHRLRVSIRCGEALTELGKLPDRSVHCIVTSPPFFRKKRYDGTSTLGWEPTVDLYLDNLTAIFYECKRVLANSGTLWVNIDDTLIDKSWQNIPGRFVERLRADGWLFRHSYVWNKCRGFSSAKDRLRNSHEPLFGFTKQSRYYFNDDTIRIPHRYHDSRRKPGALDAMPGSVLAFPTAVDPAHPAVFDVSLAEWCIRVSCPEGGAVCDPFAGVGTTGVAARDLGRGFVGIEISPTYAERAGVRLSTAF